MKERKKERKNKRKEKNLLKRKKNRYTLHGIWFLIKMPKNLMGKRKSLQQMVLKQLNIHNKKINLNPHLIHLLIQDGS